MRLSAIFFTFAHRHHYAQAEARLPTPFQDEGIAENRTWVGVGVMT